MTQAFNLAQLANNLNTSGQLDATDGLTGLIANTNLASSGTASSSTFLRGDRTWQTVTQKLLAFSSSQFDTAYNSTSSSWTNTPYSISITPTSASSTIILEFIGVAFAAQGWAGVNIRLYDNTAGSQVGSQRQVWRWDMQSNRSQYIYARAWGSQMWSIGSWGTTAKSMLIQMAVENGQEAGFNNGSDNTVFLRYWEIA